MKQLDMTPCKPYRETGKTCELREIKKKQVIWPFIDYTDPEHPNFRLRMISRKDTASVAGLWQAAYPEVYGSVHEWILHPDKYQGRVAFVDDWETDSRTMPHTVMIGEDQDTGRIVMASIYTKWDQNLHIEASFFAIHPDYRKGRIASAIWTNLALFYKWLETSGAEYVTVFCETWHNITQYIWFKRFGWKIAGIFPGNFLRWAGGDCEYRGCTVHFYRFINDGEKYATKPEEWDLLPEIRELWEYLEKTNAHSSEEGLKNP
jgi:ribosomal protein S18 acetylase RimI-like enzyme